MAANDDFSLILDPDDPSPTKTQARPASRGAAYSASSSKATPEAEKTREDALRQELASVKKVNEAIEGLLGSLQKAKTNMKTVNTSVGAASQLLNTWTRILSQTEHNQRLILDPSWQGASQDIADIEEEASAKQSAAEKHELEEQQRKAAAAHKAEEDERRRADVATRASKTTIRGRGSGSGRGLARGASTTPSTSTSANTSMLRAPSASRGRTTSIGRARGVRGKT